MPGRRRLSMVFPLPGGPTNSRLCPPAAAISSARRAVSWPRISLMSGAPAVSTASSLAGAIAGSTGASPLKVAISSFRLSTGNTAVSPPTTAASAALSRGTNMRRSPRRRAQAAMGKHPAHRPHPPVQRQLAHEQRFRRAVLGQQPRPGQDPDGDRQVVGRPVLADVRRRQVHRDLAGRQLRPDVVQRPADARPPLLHPRVGQPDDWQSRQPRRRRRPPLQWARPRRRPRQRNGRG